jgi:hypothetical protein
MVSVPDPRSDEYVTGGLRLERMSDVSDRRCASNPDCLSVPTDLITGKENCRRRAQSRDHRRGKRDREVAADCEEAAGESCIDEKSRSARAGEALFDESSQQLVRSGLVAARPADENIRHHA